MNAPLLLRPDLDQARRFLERLDPGCERWTFQTFDDDETRKHGALIQVRHGTLDEHALDLGATNVNGGGVFVMVNEGDLQGRSAGNVTRVRVLFVDLDGAPLEQVLEASHENPPHIVVESSPGKYHVYWRVDGCELNEFKERQQALAARFGGDSAVCDLPRVMRLPGFRHQKRKTPDHEVRPFMTRLLGIEATEP